MKTMRKILGVKTKAKDLGGLHYTTVHKGKMTGLFSLSTSALTNKHCIERVKNNDSICAKCFSVKQMNCYKQMNECFSKNGEILNSKILEENEIPIIPTNKFRFEAFGDLQSTYQFINYIKIAELNPEVDCALWTKNPKYIKEAIDNGFVIPKNLQIVLSSPLINIPLKTVPKFVNKVFTVYDKDYISKNGVVINCGAKSCMLCGRCYKQKDGVEFVNEMLK